MKWIVSLKYNGRRKSQGKKYYCFLWTLCMSEFSCNFFLLPSSHSKDTVENLRVVAWSWFECGGEEIALFLEKKKRFCAKKLHEIPCEETNSQHTGTNWFQIKRSTTLTGYTINELNRMKEKEMQHKSCEIEACNDEQNKQEIK